MFSRKKNIRNEKTVMIRTGVKKKNRITDHTVYFFSAVTILFAAFILYNSEVIAKQIFTNNKETTLHNRTFSSPETILKIHGSNTIGDSLMPQISKEFLKNLGASDIKVEKSSINLTTYITGSIGGKKVGISILANGSKNAFWGIEENNCDIGMSSRPISHKELEYFAKEGFGDMSSHLTEFVLATDGIAIILNKSNKIEELTTRDAARIFSGEITDWKQITGTPGRIKVHSRDKNSGTFDTFSKLVMSKRKIVDTAVKHHDNRTLSEAVSKEIGSIGFTGLPYIGNSKPVAVFEGNSSSFYPTVFSVSTEDYLLSRRLYLYKRQVSPNPFTDKFIEFCLSEKAQHIVEKEGFVSNTPRLEKPFVPAHAPKEYLKTVKDHKRLSLNIRFKDLSTQVDNKARRDIERILQFLGKPENRSGNITLIGFSDDSDLDDNGNDVSIVRAKTVGNLFRKHGIKTMIHGFGEAVPISSNHTEAGKMRNRRVEVWVSDN